MALDVNSKLALNFNALHIWRVGGDLIRFRNRCKLFEEEDVARSVIYRFQFYMACGYNLKKI